MLARRRRWERRWPATVAWVVAVLAVSACKDANDPAVAGLGVPDSGSTGVKRPVMDQRCELGETVENADSDRPEWVVAELFQAALDSDDAAAFERFYGLFPPEAKRAWVREAYWSGARKNVRDFVQEGSDEDDVAYTICRRLQQGDDKVKLFIMSHRRERSHLPITLARAAGGPWRVSSYSP